MAFRLLETDLYGALERVVQEGDSGLNLADAGGVVQLTFDAPPGELATDFIRRHYDRPALRQKTA